LLPVLGAVMRYNFFKALAISKWKQFIIEVEGLVKFIALNIGIAGE
jgi:hypothetical protein